MHAWLNLPTDLSMIEKMISNNSAYTVTACMCIYTCTDDLTGHILCMHIVAAVGDARIVPSGLLDIFSASMLGNAYA